MRPGGIAGNRSSPREWVRSPVRPKRASESAGREGPAAVRPRTLTSHAPPGKASSRPDWPLSGSIGPIWPPPLPPRRAEETALDRDGSSSALLHPRPAVAGLGAAVSPLLKDSGGRRTTHEYPLSSAPTLRWRPLQLAIVRGRFTRLQCQRPGRIRRDT